MSNIASKLQSTIASRLRLTIYNIASRLTLAKISIESQLYKVL